MDNLPPADDGGKSSFVEMTSSSVQNVFEKLVQAGLARRAENTVSLFGSSKSSLMPEEETTNPEGTISGDKNKQPIDEGNECMDLGEVESFQCYSHASAENISPTTEIEDGPLDEITILFEGRSSDNSYLTKRKRFWGAIPIRKTKQEPPETIELHEEKPTSSLRALADYLRTRKRFSLPASALLKIDVNESRISEAINQIDQDIIFEGFCLFNGLTDEKFNQRHSTMMESDFESQPAARSSFAFLPESETTAREIATNMTVHDTYMSYLQRSIKIEDVSPPQSASPKRARPSPSAAPKEKWPERYPQSTLRLKKGVDPIQTPISSAVELEHMTKTVEILTERIQEERSQREASEMELNRKIFLICQQMENLVGAVQHHVDKNSELSKIVNEVGAKLQSLDKDMKEIMETPRQAPRMSRLDPTALFARNPASTLNPTTTEKRPRRRPRLNPSKRRSSELDVRRAITPNNAKKLRLSSQPVPVEDPATIPLMPTTANNPYGYEPVIPEDERAVEKVAEEDDDDVEGMTFETFNINSKCPFCWCEEHIADDCEHIQRVEEREDFAEHHYLCLMCLRYHPLSTCERANKVCSYCGQTTHHEAVCPSDLHRVQCNNIQRRLCPLVSRNKHSSRRN